MLASQSPVLVQAALSQLMKKHIYEDGKKKRYCMIIMSISFSDNMRYLAIFQNNKRPELRGFVNTDPDSTMRLVM